MLRERKGKGEVESRSKLKTELQEQTSYINTLFTHSETNNNKYINHNMI